MKGTLVGGRWAIGEFHAEVIEASYSDTMETLALFIQDPLHLHKRDSRCNPMQIVHLQYYS